MLIYDVFTQDFSGCLNYAGTSTALGLGASEVALIVDAHQMKPGDLVFAEGDWLRIVSLVPSTEPRRRPFDVQYEYLPAFSDPSIVYAGEPWGPVMIARLRNQAARMKAWANHE